MNLPLNIPQILPVADAIQQLEGTTRVYVRLLLTHHEPPGSETGSLVVRSLVVDVLPAAWLNGGNTDPKFTDLWPSGPNIFQSEYAETFCGYLGADVIQAWFSHQTSCELAISDPDPRYRDRPLTFSFPSLSDTVSATRYPSYTPGWSGMLPYPCTVYAFQLMPPLTSQSLDAYPLIGRHGEYFANLRSLEAEKIFGITDEYQQYHSQSLVAIRSVHADGWLQTIEVLPHELRVTVGGIAVTEASVTLSPAAVRASQPVRGHHVTLPLPDSLPTEVTVVLLRGGLNLDRAWFYHAQAITGSANSAQVVVKRPDVQGYQEEPAPTAEHASANGPPPSTPPAEERSPSSNANDRSITVLRVVVASPGDVPAERACLEQVVDELNHDVAEPAGLHLTLWRWETDAYPGFHSEGPQGQIDSLMQIAKSDIVIGIFWKRFGTPTTDAHSGTEHELRIAYEAWKTTRRPHIMLYFNRERYNPQSLDEIDQWREVFAFKDQIRAEALCWDYSGNEEFKSLVSRHLRQLLIQEYGAD